MPKLSRRTLLTSAAATAAAAAMTKGQAQTDEAAEFQVEDQTPFRGQTRRLKITNRDRYVTSLIFSVDYPLTFD
jgi:nitrous oxide reductase